MSWNRKTKRQFKKLPNDQQEAVLQHLLIEKISPVMNKEITKSIIAGTDLVWEQLYSNYVSKYDAVTDCEMKQAIISDMLSTIRIEYLRIQTNKAKQKTKGEDE